MTARFPPIIRGVPCHDPPASANLPVCELVLPCPQEALKVFFPFEFWDTLPPLRRRGDLLAMSKRWVAVAALLLSAFSAQTWSQDRPDGIVLTGEVSGAQNKTYFEVPFNVPVGTHRISVDFHYSGAEQHATLDLGIADPARFRGASGGNKSHFTISETDATPSYLPGAIPSGPWRLLIAVPNLRPQTVSHYRAEIHFNAGDEDASFAARPLTSGMRWYRGDLHMHTAHSDGSCPSQSGQIVPCPLFLTVEAAASRRLDFIAITDHNADSQYHAMRELQPYFDRLLLIPGREMTTFYGHFNVFGVTQFMDYRVTRGGLDLNTVLRDAKFKGGVASVNHAEAPGGEECMGCGWEPPADVDMNLFAAVEVISGDTMLSSAKFWDAQLRDGHRLAAVGGSDNHDGTLPPGTPGSIGWPTTVVEAEGLSVAATLNGIQAGRTFVDLTASHDKLIDFEADSSGIHARMGETLHAAPGAPIRVQMHTIACTGSVIHLLLDGEESAAAPPMPVNSANSTGTATLTPSAGRHWLRVEVRDSTGTLELMSSPLYINFPDR
jgi:predicted metal-dependent phosphoesterase TrpH